MINTNKSSVNKLKNTSKGSYDSSNGNNNYFVDLDTGETLGMQGLPKKLDYDPKAIFAKIKVPGRNNSWITYSGSEDVLQLDISWYSVTNDKTDVILRCKWLESMTKADGYLGRNHFCRLQWGDLFSKSIWVITAAPYDLKDFDKPSGMMPTCATQKVTLERYTFENSTHQNINDIKW